MTPRVLSPPSMRVLPLSQPFPTVILSFACFLAKSRAFVFAPRPALYSSATQSRRLFSHSFLPTGSCSISTRCIDSSTTTARQLGRTLGTTGVSSLRSVLTSEVDQTTGLSDLLHSRNGVDERFVFFGGKGGVGKTSTAAAVAIHCADSGLRTLVISTDPAHSLGDALDQDISGGGVVGVMGLDNLCAMEVDTTEAVKEFEETLAAFNASAIAEEMGISNDIVENLGLSDLNDVLANPPPGIDELVALSRVINITRSEKHRFDRVIIDTAPTGHTLRLLSFPEFLDNFLEKVIQLRTRMGGILNLVSSMFGRGTTVTDKADLAVEKLGKYRDKMVKLRDLFRNQDATEFCIVTIPTQLAIAESKRLLSALDTQGVAVRNIIVNQVVDPESTAEYVARLHKGQVQCLDRLRSFIDGNAGKVGVGTLDVSQVPFFDMEVAGVYPLR